MKEIRNNIDKMIMDSVKSHNREEAEVYKLIKAEFLNWKTAKNAKPLDDSAEITILNKMLKQRQESASIYKSGGREDLAEKEKFEISVIEKLMPKIPSKQDIEDYISEFYPDGIEKSQMGIVIKNIKSALPGADGKLTSEIVRANINS
jgi:hypothetical protein